MKTPILWLIICATQDYTYLTDSFRFLILDSKVPVSRSYPDPDFFTAFHSLSSIPADLRTETVRLI